MEKKRNRMDSNLLAKVGLSLGLFSIFMGVIAAILTVFQGA